MRRLVATELIRPVCSIDAAHCKLPSSGQFVALCCWDADNHLLLLAYGHVPVESTEHWSWFLACCAAALPSLRSRHFILISDGDKGISAALTQILPECHHVLCSQHLLKHILPKSNPYEGGRKDLEKLYWSAVKVCHVDYLVSILQTMQTRHPDAFNYLTKDVSLEKWAPAALAVPRWGKLTSSLSEACNASVLSYRSAPVPIMIDNIMAWSIQRLIDIRASVDMLPLRQVLTPTAKAIVQTAIDEGRKLIVRNANAGMAQVSSLSRGPSFFHAVSISDELKLESCCRRWKSSFIPCRHMVALCRETGIDPLQLCSPLVLVETEKKLLDAALPAFPADTTFVSQDKRPMKPPNEQKQRGAPKKKRVLSWHDEIGERKRRVVRCGRCGQEGHYRRGCKAPLSSQL